MVTTTTTPDGPDFPATVRIQTIVEPPIYEGDRRPPVYPRGYYDLPSNPHSGLMILGWVGIAIAVIAAIVLIGLIENGIFCDERCQNRKDTMVLKDADTGICQERCQNREDAKAFVNGYTRLLGATNSTALTAAIASAVNAAPPPVIVVPDTRSPLLVPVTPKAEVVVPKCGTGCGNSGRATLDGPGRCDMHGDGHDGEKGYVWPDRRCHERPAPGAFAGLVL